MYQVSKINQHKDVDCTSYRYASIDEHQEEEEQDGEEEKKEKFLWQATKKKINSLPWF